jgi:hypothetical protein
LILEAAAVAIAAVGAYRWREPPATSPRASAKRAKNWCFAARGYGAYSLLRKDSEKTSRARAKKMRLNPPIDPAPPVASRGISKDEANIVDETKAFSIRQIRRSLVLGFEHSISHSNASRKGGRAEPLSAGGGTPAHRHRSPYPIGSGDADTATCPRIYCLPCVDKTTHHGNHGLHHGGRPRPTRSSEQATSHEPRVPRATSHEPRDATSQIQCPVRKDTRHKTRPSWHGHDQLLAWRVARCELLRIGLRR